MEFACYTAWDQLPESANALIANAAKDSIFFSRPWFDNVEQRGLKADQSILLACVVDGEQVLAILPLMTRDHGRLDALAHLYTSLYSVLLSGTGRPEILACLADGLGRLQTESLRLAPVADDDAGIDQLQHALEARGYACFRKFRFYNWVYRLRGESFADYMAGRPSRVRNTIARKRRKLEREHGYRIRLFAGEDIQRGMADYTTVYNASWKAREQFGGFVDGLASRLSDQGWLRLAVLYIADRPAAAQLWFVAHGKASIFRLAYDEAWKPYSPGSILIHHLMEHAIDTERVGEIDFLYGNDPYKQDWMSERRERWGLYCARPRVRKGRADRWLDAVRGWVLRRKGPERPRPCSANPQQ